MPAGWPSPEDFNDWGSDPNGVAKAAALAVTLTWSKSWEVSKMPLGHAELWQFGPNGPPMNVMDTCSVSKTLWIANQILGHKWRKHGDEGVLPQYFYITYRC